MKQFKPFLEHILEETDYLNHEVENLTYPEFLQNETLKRSFVRALEVTGEAAKNIPDDVRERYPKIPWKDMAGLRDILIHHYFGINYKIVWDVVKNQVPGLRLNIQAVLKDIEKE
ncbi:MAG: DUF86 domain-containing protein [Candidatus Aminicenantes bacterium]|nr:DUF86 domain-containing protein [Candidatus Aminicenantes bacterium]